MKNLKFNISGPIGAFANHVRWLMLLDPLFSITFHWFDLQEYLSLRGPDWPSYENYVNKNLVGVLEEIKKEFNELDAYFEFDTIDNKICAFKDKIYSESRTWHNWLIIEWKFRKKNLDKFVGLTHNIRYEKTSAKNLLLTIDPELAHRCYLKFNSNLNNMSAEDFKKTVAVEINNYKRIAELDPAHYQIIASDVLYQPILDRNFYNKLIDWFDLTDNYKLANRIHQLWYNAHQRAEKEFRTDIEIFYSIQGEGRYMCVPHSNSA